MGSGCYLHSGSSNPYAPAQRASAEMVEKGMSRHRSVTVMTDLTQMALVASCRHKH